MNGFVRLCRMFVLAAVAFWFVSNILVATVGPGDVGVRQSNLTGVLERDLEPGWHFRIAGLHKLIVLPAKFFFLDYTADERNSQGPLQIRTRDNNTVLLDVSVPYRIRVDEAFELVKGGNHVLDGNDRFRFQRLAQDSTVSVLREQLAQLTSREFYTTERRLEVSERTLTALNESLASLHLEAEAVLIRAVSFRPEYENQLQQIQLNEQNKLLDRAREKVANEQQNLDNYVQGTKALASTREQEWVKRLADLDRAYQVGFVGAVGDVAPGAARRALAALTPDARTALENDAAKVLGSHLANEMNDAYLLGIKAVQAETLEYKRRVTSEADAVSARLSSEGAALVARVRGDYDARLNSLLNSRAGRAYVAWKSAGNVSFAERLWFHSGEGIPAVLRLHEFASQFMGR